MEIANWVYSIRVDRGLTLTDISELIDIAPSQISRIENKQSDLTLLTAAKIIYALDVNLMDMANGLSLHKSVLDLLVYNKAPIHSSTVTIDDIERLLVWYSKTPTIAKQFLYESFSEIRFRSGFQKLNEYSKSWDMVKAAIEPSGTDYVRIQYPAGLDNDMIRESLSSHGVLGFQDLGLFIRQARQSSDLGLVDLSKKTGISYSALRRIEVGEIERIKIEDILAIDEKLGDYGEILAVAWNVAQFYSGILRNKNELEPLKLWNERELALAETLIAISRWYKVHSPNADWLKQLRII